MLQKMNQKGFTLIELMIVIAIIGILAAIAIPNFLSYRQKGQDQAAQSSAKNYYNTAMAYFADKGATTVGSMPTGFQIDNTVISHAGSLTMDNNGAVTGTATFSHSGSTKTFTLQGSDGSVSGS